MKSSRTKNVFKIISSNILLQIAIAVYGLILPRLFIKEYGSEINGLVSSIRQFLTYFSVVSSGISVASTAALYKPLVQEDYNKINGILSATAVFFRKSAYIFISLLSILTFIYPFMVTCSEPKIEIVILVLILSAGTIIEYLFLSKYRALVTADQKLNVEINIQTQGYILNTIVSVILIHFHCSIIIVQLVATFVYVLRAFRLIHYVKVHYPYVNFNVSPDMDAISNRWAAFSYQVSGIVISYTPVVLLTFMCGLKDVSVYSVYNMVFVLVGMIVNVFSSGLSASFGNVIVQKDRKTLLNSYNTYEFIYFTISFICYACASKLILPFVSVYTKNITDVNYIVPQVAVWFVISGLTRMFRTPAVTLVEAAGKFTENKNLNMIEAVVDIVLSIIFTLSFGISGVLIGAAISSFIRSLCYMFYVQLHLLRRNMIKVIARIMVDLVLLVVIYYIPICIYADNFIQFFIQALIIFLLSFSIYVVSNSVMDVQSFKDVVKRIKGLL